MSPKTNQKLKFHISDLFFGILFFLASQRFSLNDIDEYIAILIIPFIIINLINQKSDKFIFYYLIFLFLSVDRPHNIDSYTTIDFLRRIIYLLLLIYIFLKINFRINYKIIFLLTFSVSLGLINGLLSGVHYKFSQVQIDLIMIVFFFCCLCNKPFLNPIIINFNHLFLKLSFYIFFYLIGELLNILFYNKLHYINLNSLKSFIAIPLIYFLFKKKYFNFLIYLIPTFVVINSYSTRMIFLLLICIFILFIIKMRVNFLKLLFFFIIPLVSYYALIDLLPFTKVNQVIRLADFQYTNLNNLLSSLSETRYLENVLFFSQNITSILFGNGIGSGIYDSNNILSSVSYDETAFSREELDTRWFFGFHDFHIDIGVRFGLLLFIIILFKLIYSFFLVKDNNKSLYLALIIFYFPLTFFSVPGVLFLIILTIMLNSEAN